MTKEEFIEKMMKQEQFKKAEKRRQLIWEKKKGEYLYKEFNMDAKQRETKRKNK